MDTIALTILIVILILVIVILVVLLTYPVITLRKRLIFSRSKFSLKEFLLSSRGWYILRDVCAAASWPTRPYFQGWTDGNTISLACRSAIG